MKYNIYITRDIEAKREGNSLKIENKKIPLSIIKSLFIIGNGNITKSARNLLLRNSKPIYFFDYRYNLLGMLVNSHFDSNYKLRLRQYENFGNIEFAKLIVLKKLETIEKYTSAMDRYKKKIEKVKTLNEILGIEGSASAYMFLKFKEELEKIGIFEFTKRVYRPVKDRINGLLSFLYTLYYSYLYGEVISEGFDPFIGFLHIKRGKHAVFVSDMMEEARVELTFLAVEILKDIYEDGFEGLYLNSDARKYVLRKFDKFILNYENSLLKEVKEQLC
jgi:CRISPR-associated protein Cas1